jgi:hypothetical protein
LFRILKENHLLKKPLSQKAFKITHEDPTGGLEGMIFEDEEPSVDPT